MKLNATISRLRVGFVRTLSQFDDGLDVVHLQLLKLEVVLVWLLAAITNGVGALKIVNFLQESMDGRRGKQIVTRSSLRKEERK